MPGDSSRSDRNGEGSILLENMGLLSLEWTDAAVPMRRGAALNGISAEDCAWGAASRAGAELADACGRTVWDERVSGGKKSRQSSRGRSQSVNRRHGSGRTAGIRGTMRRRRENRDAGCRLSAARDQRAGHGAVMRPVAAAAGRQARIVAGLDGRRKRSESKQQSQKN